MKNVIGHFLIVTLTLSMVTGCASINVAKNTNDLALTEGGSAANNVEHMNASISGLYLIASIPLITGDTSGKGMFVTSKDTVNLDNAVNYLTKRAQADGATKITDMTSSSSSRPMLLPIPFVLWMKSVHVSANATK